MSFAPRKPIAPPTLLPESALLDFSGGEALWAIRESVRLASGAARKPSRADEPLSAEEIERLMRGEL